METITGESVLIENNGDLRSLKNQYQDAIRNVDKKYRVVLTFCQPITLHYGRRISNRKTNTVHTVKSIFFTDGKYCNCMFEKDAVPKKVYYVAGSMRRAGFRLYTEHLVSIEIKFVKRDYTNEWQNIAKSMRKHNINLDIAEAIEKHLRGEEEHIRGFQNYWKKSDKPRRMSFKDVLRGDSIEDLKSKATSSEYSDDKMVFYRRIYGEKRDRSISLSFDKKDSNSHVGFDAASEFTGCGNGDYYCMYSPTMAFYAETD